MHSLATEPPAPRLYRPLASAATTSVTGYLPLRDDSIGSPLCDARTKSPQVESPGEDTRVGTVELAIRKLREGELFPGAAGAAPPQRALLAVVQQIFVEGISLRSVDDLVQLL